MTQPSGQNDARPGAWQCGVCGASVDRELHACWQCGGSREGELDPNFKLEVGLTLGHEVCPECRYPVRDLTGEQCPKCGTAYDPGRVDTLNDSPVRHDDPDERELRNWLRASLASWGAVFAVAIVASWFDDQAVRRIMAFVAVTCLITAFVVSMFFLLHFFSDVSKCSMKPAA